MYNQYISIEFFLNYIVNWIDRCEGIKGRKYKPCRNLFIKLEVIETFYSNNNKTNKFSTILERHILLSAFQYDA